MPIQSGTICCRYVVVVVVVVVEYLGNRGHWKPNRNQIETEKKKLGSREIVEHKIERGITRSLFRWKLWSVGRSVGWLVDFLWFCFGGLQERKDRE